MAFWSKKSPAPAAPAPPPPPQYATEPERETLRARHNLRPITDEEEGTGWRRLPGGVYGFVYMPALNEFPLFRVARYHNFEVHKVAADEVLLVGYVSRETAAQLEAQKETTEIQIYPDLRDHASALISVPLARVIRIKEFSAREDGSLGLQLGHVQ